MSGVTSSSRYEIPPLGTKYPVVRFFVGAGVSVGGGSDVAVYRPSELSSGPGNTEPRPSPTSRAMSSVGGTFRGTSVTGIGGADAGATNFVGSALYCFAISSASGFWM